MFYNASIDISSEKWGELLVDGNVTTDADLRVLRYIYNSPNHEASGKEIALHLKMGHHWPLNSQMGRFGKRVLQKTEVNPPTRSDGSIRWWHIPFLGYEKSGRFPWIMRQELSMAFEEIYGLENSEEETLVYLDEVLIEDSPILSEGQLKAVSVNRYERNRKARNICLKHYGSKCIICGFDFEKIFGPVGSNKIHVHHIAPISQAGGRDYIINPIKDLQPVCPNCHTIIHSKREPFSIEEVKEILRGQHNGA